jgi:hypothetical protein
MSVTMRHPKGTVASGSLMSARAPLDGSRGASGATRAINGVLLQERARGGAQSSRAARISSSAFDRLSPTGSARMGVNILKKPCSSGGAAAPAEATLRTARSQRRQTRRAASPRFLKRNPRLLEQCGQVSDRKRSCRSHMQLSTNAQLRRT